MMNRRGIHPEEDNVDPADREPSNGELDEKDLEFIFGGIGDSGVTKCRQCDNVAAQGFDLCADCLRKARSGSL